MKKLLFTSLKEHNTAFLFQDDTMVDIFVADTPSRVGSIYIGKIKNIVKNIDACFVEIADGELCFLSMKDAKCARPLNRTADGRILEGDELLVQVIRDAIKTKQAAVTTKISLSNDYFAITLSEDNHLGISNKLSVKRKNSLKHVLMENNYIDSDGRLTKTVSDYSYGLVLRTACNSFDLSDLIGKNPFLCELDAFLEEMEALLKKASHSKCLSCIKEAKTPVLKAYEYFSKEFPDEIITDDPDAYEELLTFVGEGTVLRKYEDVTYPLAKLYGLESKVIECLKPYVWLKSGANLVIEQTECLCTIDINSGKYDKKTAKKNTGFEINMEACKEIARQIRLRNLSGIIIVDFINMESDEQKEQVLETLKKYTSYDRIQTSVIDMTPLGLVEVTRKKINPSLKEQLTWL